MNNGTTRDRTRMVRLAFQAAARAVFSNGAPAHTGTTGNRTNGRGRAPRRLLAGAALGAVAMLVATAPASAATTASFSNGTLTVFGDALGNTITISRNAAGNILVNGGSVAVLGGTPTVANTALIQVFGQGGNDVITINEASGALPKANLFGGAGNDTLTG